MPKYSYSYQLNFDEVLGGGAVDDGHERVLRLHGPEADGEPVDVRVRSLVARVCKRDQAAQPAERVRHTVYTHHTSLNTSRVALRKV